MDFHIPKKCLKTSARKHSQQKAIFPKPKCKMVKNPSRRPTSPRQSGDAVGCNRADKLGHDASAVPVYSRCPVRMDEQAKERIRSKNTKPNSKALQSNNPQRSGKILFWGAVMPPGTYGRRRCLQNPPKQMYAESRDGKEKASSMRAVSCIKCLRPPSH